MRSAIETTSPMLRPLLMHLASERGLADNSLRAYRGDLEDAEKFLLGRALGWLSAGGDDYCAYLQAQSLAGMGTKTVARRFVALRTMLRYLLGEYEGNAPIEERLTRALTLIERPKPKRPLPKILSRADTGALMARGANPKSKLWARDVAILELLYACGLRASELCGLRVGDVNLRQRSVRAFGKGGKERIVPLGRGAAQAIERYLKDRPASPKAARVDRLFLTPSGGKLTRERLFQIVEAAGERAGLSKPISPHTLRHCYATHMLAGGADLRVVQETLGHNDIETTEIYTHVDASKLKAMHQKFHPRG